MPIGLEHRLKAPFEIARVSAVSSMKSAILAVTRGVWYPSDAAASAVSAAVGRWMQLNPADLLPADRAHLDGLGAGLAATAGSYFQDGSAHMAVMAGATAPIGSHGQAKKGRA